MIRFMYKEIKEFRSIRSRSREFVNQAGKALK